MNILLIGMHFGNYELKIKAEFEQQGHRVTLLHSFSKSDACLKCFLSSKRIADKRHNYQLKQLSKINIKDIDVVIVIVGRELCIEFYQELKEKSQAHIILYLWDDVKRVENFETIKKYIDEVVSFDPIDAYKYGFRFLPLFYTDEFYPTERKQLLDVYSAMSNHSDRLYIAKSLNNTYRKNLKMKFIVNTGRVAYLKQWIQNVMTKASSIKMVSKPISKAKNKQYMDQCKALLDIPFSGQVGLTIRTLEALGNQTKLITTNRSIQYYDFYNENNICIIDRKNPELNLEFIDSPYIKMNSIVSNKYSLETWCKTILGYESHNYLTCDLEKVYVDLFGRRKELI